jgi:IS5 family transposase
MKAHIGVDSRSKIIHSVAASAANIHDSLALPVLLHGKETCVWGDSAYQGQSGVIHKHARKARDMTNRRCRYRGQVDEVERRKNRHKSSVRAKVEHPFLILNCARAPVLARIAVSIDDHAGSPRCQSDQSLQR